MKKIIILAGNGSLPINIIKNLRKRKISFFSLIISNSGWNSNIERFPFKVINLGTIITEIKKLQNEGFGHIIFAGSIKRPIISDIKPDFNSLKLIPKFTKVLLKGGDDFLFKFIISELKKLQFKVLDIKSVAPELFLSKGIKTNKKPCKIAKNDIQRGESILNTLSKYDVGQSIIVQQGEVLGIEAIEGTDRLIRRISKYRRKGVKPTLIKLFKKKQELKADLPTIGFKTILECNNFSIGGIAYLANKTLFIDHEKIINKINKNKMFLIGI